MIILCYNFSLNFLCKNGADNTGINITTIRATQAAICHHFSSSTILQTDTAATGAKVKQ